MSNNILLCTGCDRELVIWPKEDPAFCSPSCAGDWSKCEYKHQSKRNKLGHKARVVRKYMTKLRLRMKVTKNIRRQSGHPWLTSCAIYSAVDESAKKQLVREGKYF